MLLFFGVFFFFFFFSAAIYNNRSRNKTTVTKNVSFHPILGTLSLPGAQHTTGALPCPPSHAAEGRLSLRCLVGHTRAAQMGQNGFSEGRHNPHSPHPPRPRTPPAAEGGAAGQRCGLRCSYCYCSAPSTRMPHDDVVQTELLAINDS